MRVIRARNVHQALPFAKDLIDDVGQKRDSRNGPVFVADAPVATVYLEPLERVVFWPQRDANPFLHLYESLWMLAGRKDAAPLIRYSKQFAEYSDNGQTFHGAYGYRWRKHFGPDQLERIIRLICEDPSTRRAVLGIWDPIDDLGTISKDIPCNLAATFQVNRDGRLDMVVFNRSNDIVWGCYGANAVHFAFLQEYISLGTGYPVGTYTQISVNWHVYQSTAQQLLTIPSGADLVLNSPRAEHGWKFPDPYERGEVRVIPMPPDPDFSIARLLIEEENFFNRERDRPHPAWVWENMVYSVLRAHMLWRTKAKPECFDLAIQELSHSDVPQDADWVVAAKEWIERRRDRWQSKMEGEK